MLKAAVIMSLILMVSEVWSSRVSCQSCGRECVAACGTRYFRSCCFNYLRKKRTDPMDAFQSPGKEGDTENLGGLEFKNNPFVWIEAPTRPFYVKPFYAVKDFLPLDSLDENNLFQKRLRH